MRSRQFGTRRERQVRDKLLSDDWIVFRPGASLGVADLVALRAGDRPRLVQVKGSAGGPYEHFSPAERLKLIGTARLAGADPWLAWWPPRGVLRWIPAEEWPNAVPMVGRVA